MWLVEKGSWGSKELEGLLADGWEPFAARAGMVYLRREEWPPPELESLPFEREVPMGAVEYGLEREQVAASRDFVETLWGRCESVLLTKTGEPMTFSGTDTQIRCTLWAGHTEELHENDVYAWEDEPVERTYPATPVDCLISELRDALCYDVPFTRTQAVGRFEERVKHFYEEVAPPKEIR